MELSTLALAVLAGSVAAFNPCGFAMLPAYLALVVGEGQRAPLGRIGRALAATGAMATGFLLVFGAFGLVLASVLGAVAPYLPIATVVIGVGLVGLGLAMLAGWELTPRWRGPGRGAPTARLGSMFGYGVAYALASLSCTIGPFLAATGAGLGSGSVPGTVSALLAYGAGMALVVGVLSVGAALAGDVVAQRARRVLPHVNRIAGVLLVLVGTYVAYYGIWEIRLAAGGDGADPVIDSAIAVQQALVDAVGWIGPGPLLAVLGLLVLGGLLWGRRCRRPDAASTERPASNERPAAASTERPADASPESVEAPVRAAQHETDPPSPAGRSR